MSRAILPRVMADGQVLLQTDADTVVLGRMNRVERRAADATSETPERIWVVILGPDDPEGEFPAWMKGQIPAEATTIAITPRGWGTFAGYEKRNPPNYFERSPVLLGRTLDMLRVGDIQAVARWLHENEPGERLVGVIGRGEAGVLGAYAALFDTCIADVKLIDPPASHRTGPAVLGVLKVLDIPQALGLLSPRRLTLVGAPEQLAGPVQAWYEASGQAERLRVLPTPR